MTVSVQTGGWPPVPGPVVGLVGQVAVLAALAVGVGLGPAGWLAATAYAVLVTAALTRGLRRSGMADMGPANAVTLGRATLVGGVTALVADSATRPVPVAAVVCLAAVALLLDAVDGQVARRTGTSSPLGARFDMEIDAFLILVLSVFVAQQLGGWVLAAGAARYAFVAAVRVLPWLGAALPPSPARKTVAAVQGIALAVAGAAVLPRPLAVLLVGAAVALLAWSFGRDVGWLWRRHRAGAERFGSRGADWPADTGGDLPSRPVPGQRRRASGSAGPVPVGSAV